MRSMFQDVEIEEEMMEAVNKLCELCRTETPEDGRRICEKCLGTSTVLDVVPGTESSATEKCCRGS